MRKCEKCQGPGPTLWDDSAKGSQRYLCRTCHASPEDSFFVREAEKAAMALPAGKTCGDCHWWRKCSALIGSLTGKETSCDFHPSRFRERKAT